MRLPLSEPSSDKAQAGVSATRLYTVPEAALAIGAAFYGTLYQALAHDIAGCYELAAAQYELAISQPNAPLDAFANLAFILWEATAQHRFTNGNPIPQALAQRPWNDCLRVLEAGLQRYPHDLELSFLRRYFPYRAIYDEFTETDCRHLLATCVNHNQTILPRFFLALFAKRNSAELTELLTICVRQPTAKFQWVSSILKGSLARYWEE